MRKILLVHGLLDSSRQTNVDYAMSLAQWPHGHHVHTTNILAPWTEEMLRCSYDLLVITYEVAALRTLPEWKWVCNRLRKVRSACSRGIVFVQDDYTAPVLIDKLARDLELDAIFSPLAEHADIFYPESTRYGIPTHGVLTGYIHPERARVQAALARPLRERHLDLGQRVSLVPEFYGEQAQIKSSFASEIARLAQARGLVVDVDSATTTPLLGDAWLEFLRSARFVPGALGGASAADLEGKYQRHRARIALASSLLSRDFKVRGAKGHLRSGSFRAVGPRIFEAAMTRTCQVLLEGDYLPELVADTHYISVHPGPSGLDSAVLRMRDLAEAEYMVEAAWMALIAAEKYLFPTAVARWLQEAGTPPLGPAPSGQHTDEQSRFRAYLDLDPLSRYQARCIAYERLTSSSPLRRLKMEAQRWLTTRHAEGAYSTRSDSSVNAGANELMASSSLQINIPPESLIWPWSSPKPTLTE